MQKYLRVASDLHLEAFYGRDPETLAIDFLMPDDRDADSILVLAGDVCSQPERLVQFLAVCLKRFPKVVYVPGNHEYYRQDYDGWNKTMDKALSELGPNLLFSTRGMKQHNLPGLRFIIGTMWGDGGPTLKDRAMVGAYLNDFRLITRENGLRRFSTTDMIEEFKQAREQLQEMLSTPCGMDRTIVVTHHLPSRALVSERFWPGDGSDGANGGFVGECEDLMATTEPISPWLWIHGHTHDTIDRMLWETRIVCNPAGYRGEWCSPFNTFMPHVPGESAGKFVEL